MDKKQETQINKEEKTKMEGKKKKENNIKENTKTNKEETKMNQENNKKELKTNKEKVDEKNKTNIKENKQDIKTNEKETKEKEISKDKEKKVDKKNKQKPQIKKDKASVRGFSLPISTKDAVAVCRFIKYKTIDNAINDLEEVIQLKKSIPMKGEIPHKKGKGKIGSGSGRYPKKASYHILKLLKSLKINSENNGIEEPIISLAIANIAQRPIGRFGRTKKKRTHIEIIATELKLFKENGRKKSS